MAVSLDKLGSLLANALNAGVPSDTPNVGLLRRVRLIHLATAAMLVLASLLHLHAGPHVPGACAAALGLALANLWLLRRTYRVSLCGNLLIAVFAVLLVSSLVQGGGLDDPRAAWLYALPVTAFLVLGIESGWGWSFATLAALGGLWVVPEWSGGGAEAILVRGPERGIALALPLLGIALAGTVLVHVQGFAERRLLRTQKALEREARLRREARALAEGASEAKGEFLANMSHEIRTPMTAILGFAELLEESFEEREPTDEQQDAVATIKRNGEHLLCIINDVLDLSKIEAGKLEVERVPLALREHVEDVVSLLRMRAEEKGLEFSVEYAGAVPETLQGDPVRLRQVLINLLANAIKFTQRGFVRLRVERVDEGLCFEVSDSGIGMREDECARLFEPFWQADGGSARRFGGTGLGLAICTRLSDLMGGRIDVESRPGEGSTFRLVLACEESEPAAPDADAPVASVEEPDALAGARILLVDASPDDARLIERFLTSAGAAVERVADGVIAVQRALDDAAKGEPFDVVVMETAVPRLGGVQATRRLRRAGYRGAIVALTARAMSTERQACVDAGCDEFLTKPIERDALVQQLSRFAR